MGMGTLALHLQIALAADLASADAVQPCRGRKLWSRQGRRNSVEMDDQDEEALHSLSTSSKPWLFS